MTWVQVKLPSLFLSPRYMAKPCLLMWPSMDLSVTTVTYMEPLYSMMSQIPPPLRPSVFITAGRPSKSS